jgi:hypothetical protein
MTDEKDEKKLEKERQAKEKAAEERMTSLENSLMEQGKGLNKLLTAVEGLSGSLESLKKEPKDKDRRKVDQNLETLDRSGFLGVILEEVRGLLKEEVAPVKQAVQDTSDDATKADVKRQVAKAEKAHPDLWEWREEMGEIAKRSPGLTVEEIYKLARASDPDKVKEVDEKFRSDEDKEKEKTVEKEKKATEEQKALVGPFGGLTPTSGKTAEKNDMTMEDAAETAFDKVFGPGEKATS